MSDNMALSGSKAQIPPADVQTFMKGFIAELVSKGRLAVHPRDLPDRRGFQSVVDLLDEEADRIEATRGDEDYLNLIVSVANRLRPSNTGAYDGFESELRALQLTFTRVPDYSYRDITFTVPEPFARSVIDKLPENLRGLVERAAERFILAQTRR